MTGWRKRQIMENQMIELADDVTNIKNMLNNGPCLVQFTKVDGTKRTMKCTLNDAYLPLIDHNKVSVKKHNPDVLAVWDIDNSGWRSFRINSIVSVKVIND